MMQPHDKPAATVSATNRLRLQQQPSRVMDRQQQQSSGSGEFQLRAAEVLRQSTARGQPGQQN